MNGAISASPVRSFFHPFRVAAWLVWIDILQGVRRHMGARTWRDSLLRGGGLLFGLAFFVGLHVAAFALVVYAWVSPTSADQKGALMAGLSTSVWCFLLFVMFSGGLMRALVVLHEQDDSSLLMSSPVTPRAVLAARLFGNALQSCVVDGFIIVPYINARIFTLGGRPNFLWGYLLWFTLAIIVTCLDGLFSFGLIRLLGLRRARTFSQAVPFILVFGVTFFAGSVSVSIAQMDSLSHTQMPPEIQEKFMALSNTPLVWLAWAGAGRLEYLGGFVLFALALSAVTLWLTERSFIEGTQHMVEGETSARPGTADGPFRGGVLRLEVLKGLRLIVRTPMILVQTLAQALMPVGIAFVLGREDLARGFAFFVIFANGVLCGMFTIAAGTVEECEDLLEMAPLSSRIFRIGKIVSGCFWPMAVTLLTGLGMLVTEHWILAVAVLAGGVPLGLATSIAGETFTTPVRPGQRPKLLADPIMMIPLLGMQVISGAVAGGAVFASLLAPMLLPAALIGGYLLMVLAVGLAQLRRPILFT